MIKKVSNWAENLLLGMLIIIIAFIFISSDNESGQPQSFFGYKLMAVLSGSMEPVLHTGDIVVSKMTNPEEINVNDVVTYQTMEGPFVTHRVVDLVQQDDSTLFETKGDANNIKDQELISEDQLVGTMQFHIPKAGYVINFVKSPLGIFILVTSLVFILGMKPILKFFGSDKSKDQKRG